MKRIHRQSAFTMIELLIAATIIIVLTTIGLVSYQNANRNGRNAKRKSDLATVQQSLVLYRTEEGSYPDGNGSAAAFETMVSTIDDHISNESSIQDPMSPTYDYSYESDGSTFEVCTTLELPAGATQQYCVESP